MKLSGSHQLRQKQSVVITAQLQQAIRLLTMTNVELGAFIESESEENPFLDCETTGETDAASDNKPAEADADVANGEMVSDGPIKDADYDNQFETGTIEVGRGTRTAGGGDDFDPLSLRATETPSLYAHASIEMYKLDLAPNEKMIANALIEALEPSGWLGLSVEDIAETLLVDEMEVEKVLIKLQGIEPAGLFARGLAECLRLQARDRDLLHPDFAALLDNLSLLASGDLPRLRKMLGVAQERLSEMLRLLRSLDPKPGTRFTGTPEPIQPPDLIVRQNAQGWSVELNRSTLPAVRVHKGYAKSMISKTGKKDETAREFITERVSTARWLNRAIAQRNETTLKIGAEIVRQQQAFFEHGVAYLRPLVLRDVAEAIGMHESTVSRVTANLMMVTPQGTFRLKDFFSASIASDSSDDGEAASAIRYKLKKLIDSEPAKAPFSDDTLVKMLGDDGIRIARRTVAKYRDQLKIPSSFQRKRQAALSGLI